jgi:O-antigen ligase
VEFVPSYSLLLLGAVLGLGFLILLSKWPRFGLLVLVAVSPLDQLQRIPGIPFLNVAKVVGALLILSWASYILVLRKGRYCFVRTGVEIPLALFLFVLLLRLPPAIDFIKAITHFASLFSYALLYVVIVNLVRDTRLVNKLVHLLIFVSVLVSLLAIAQFVTQSTIIPWALGDTLRRGGAPIQRATGAARNPNMGAFLPVLVFPLSATAWLSEKRRTLRFLFALSSVCILAGAAVMMSRSAYVAIALEVIVLTLVLRRKVLRLRYILIALVLVAILSFLLPLEVIVGDRIGSIVDLEVGQRFEIYRGWGEMLADYPLLGVGLGNFEDYIVRYIGIPIAPHNNIISISGEAGLFGILAFVWLSWAPIWILWRRLQVEVRSQYRSLLGGFLASVIGYQVNGLFHTSFVWNLYWIVLALGMVVVSVLCARSKVRLTSHYESAIFAP